MENETQTNNPQDTPHQIQPSELQANQSAAQVPAQVTTTLDNPKVTNFKKYLIAAVVALAFLTSIFLGYVFFFKNDVHEEKKSPTELNNKLSDEKTTMDTPPKPPDNKADLEKVVNELKDQYSTDTNNTPPGITITIPDTSTDTSANYTTDTETSTEPPSKIER